MAAVTITMSGDDARLRAAHERLLRDQQKLLDKYNGLGKASKEAGETDAQAKAKAEAVTKRYLTTLEKLQSDLTEVKRLYDKGAVSAETLARAEAKVTQEQQRLNAELHDTTAETKKLKEAEAQEAQEKSKAEATTKRYLTTLEKLQVELADVKRQYDQGRVSLETLERAQQAVNQEQNKMTGSTGLKAWGANLAGIATSYLSINTAIQTVIASMEEQEKLNQKSLTEVERLALAQQEAIKNMTGLSQADVLKGIDTIPRQIQAETKFPSRSKLVEAMGEAYSTVSDLGMNKSAVTAAAELVPLKPDDVGVISRGILNTMNATGVADARKASGFMASVGAESPVNDPAKLATNLTPVVQSAMTQFKGASKQEIAIQSGSIFSTLSELAGDNKGEAASTAGLTLQGKLNEFFQQITNPESKGNLSRLDDISQLRKTLSKSAYETGNVSPEMLKQLSKLRDEQVLVSSIKDPDTPFGQLEMLQKNKGLFDMFFESGFGEERFKEPMKQLAVSGSQASATLMEKYGKIAFDPQFHSDNVTRLGGATPELRIAQAQSAAASSTNSSELDPVRAATAAIVNIRDTALAQTRKNASDYAGDTASRGFFNRFAYQGNNPVRAAEAASQELFMRSRMRLSNDADGITSSDRASVQLVQDNLLQLANTLEAVIDRLDTASKKQAVATIESIRNESTNAAARLQAAKAGQ